jgi:hypothetical protein
VGTDLLAGVGGGDDFAYSLLVEAFVAFVAFEVFQVGADGALGAELLGLFGGDQVGGEEALQAVFGDGPALAFGEGLAEVGVVGEGLHDGDIVVAFELRFERVEIELAFEVMHAGLKEGFAMEAAPEADGAQSRARFKGFVGEIGEEFFGGEVDIVEGDDAGAGVFHDLGAPAGFAAGVEAFAAFEAEFFEETDEVAEINAGGSVSVVVVVAPAQAQAILAGFLDLGGAVAALPEFAFGGEEKGAGLVGAEVTDGQVDQGIGVAEAFDVIFEGALAAAEAFEMFGGEEGSLRIAWREEESEGAAAFDGVELVIAGACDGSAAHRGEGFTFDINFELIHAEEIGDGVGFDGDMGNWTGGESHTGEHAFGMAKNSDILFVALDREAGFFEAGFVGFLLREDEGIDPVEETRAGIFLHVVGEAGGGRATVEEFADHAAEESFCGGLAGPLEGLEGVEIGSGGHERVLDIMNRRQKGPG